MDLSLLEDFLALAEAGNFSRAAAARYVTQPAFSRRIQTLEQWFGVPLFERNRQGISLTEAGDRVRRDAEELVRKLYRLRRDANESASRGKATLHFSATHSLSFAFFPSWIRRFAVSTAHGGINLVSDTMDACEKALLHGRAQFLLCHYQPSAPQRLSPKEFRSCLIGHDTLVPLAAPDNAGKPLWQLPGTTETPVFCLRYSTVSGFSRVIDAQNMINPCVMADHPDFTSHLAMVLMTLACDGRGMAWLPLSLAEQTVREGQLMRAGSAQWDIPLEVRLYRPHAPQSKEAEQFWAEAEATAPGALASPLPC